MSELTLWLDGGAASADAGAVVVRETWLDDRTVDLTIQSPSLDAPHKRVRLLLPATWSRTTSRSWPTLYLLHGGVADHTSWTDNSDIAQLAAARPAIVALPETSWCSAYSDWWNGGAGGAPMWETFVTGDVRRILERGYRASQVRAVAGVSMGGLGAMKFAARHPGMFAAAASFSGNLDPLHSHCASADGVDRPGLGCGADWTQVWGDPAIPAQREIWERNNPYDQAAKLAGTQLYVTAGDGAGWDPIEAQASEQSRAFTTKLHSLGIPVTSRFYNGAHGWDDWRRELRTAFPMLMSSIGA